MARFSADLHRYFFEDEPPTDVRLTHLLELAGERVFGFLLVLLSLPSALPVPAPGYSVPFGILIVLLAVQFAAGREEPWFPRFIRQRHIGLKQTQQVLSAGLPWLKRLEALSRPRMTYFCRSSLGRLLLGGAIALMGISMMIPLPLTNTFPAIGVFITGFSLIEEDGLVGLAGLAICSLAGAISTALVTAYFLGGLKLVE
ncbi:MAG: exopolysaccharide biosynthesis protein, partial [Cyanobacteria bacterium P01_A01_bin.135]